RFAGRARSLSGQSFVARQKGCWWGRSYAGQECNSKITSPCCPPLLDNSLCSSLSGLAGGESAGGNGTGIGNSLRRAHGGRSLHCAPNRQGASTSRTDSPIQ